jgi:para-nitrobenzyl esterase
MSNGSTFFKLGLFSDRARSRFKYTGITLALALTTAALIPTTQANATSANLVHTNDGPVQGFVKNGVTEFLGIRYAAPPVGKLRWMPPQSPAPWTKVLQATAFGPTCAQITEFGVFAGPANNNEDCLFLNVFTPNVDPAAKEKLPVIFFIHGGGNIDGESNDYDGSKLAAQGHTVVVTINYRLGILGFLAHPALDAEGHLFANYGTLDQQFALKWVQQNIAEFGGDKNNVTVGGQSAGSINTAANVLSPLAAGLFHRAIFQSVLPEPAPLAFAESLGTNFAVAAGCGSGATAAVAKCLRNLTAAQIIALQGTTVSSGPFGGGQASYIADGQIIPSAGLAGSVKSGQFNHMPIMSGTTKDEGNFFAGIIEFFSGPPRVPVTEADFTNFITTTFTGPSGPGGSGPDYPAGTVAKVKAQYPLSAYPTPQLAYDAVWTDWQVVCQQHAINKLLATQVPVYAYEFADQTAPYYFPKMPGFAPLAAHTTDIQYLFPLYHGGPTGIPHQLNNTQEQLSDKLVAAWTNFAWTGNPNGQGKMPWPLYNPNKPNVASMLSENVPVLSTITDAEYVAEHKCDFWDEILTF